MHVATALRATYIFAALTLMVSQADSTLFAWHPIFMTAGFLAFMVEGVLTALDFRAREGTPRVRAIQKHATLQMAASACILLGFTAIVANKVPWTGSLAMRGACRARQLLMVQCCSWCNELYIETDCRSAGPHRSLPGHAAVSGVMQQQQTGIAAGALAG